MNINSLRWIAFAVTLLVGCTAALSASEPPKEETAIVTKLITAMVSSDYDAFVSDGDAPFKQLRKEQFDAVSAKLGPKLGNGYEIFYLGELKQRGYRVTLWKLSFKSGSDDALATLSLKGGKVGGFFIR